MPKFNDQQYRHPHHHKLHLYLRPNSPNWWCVFYHKSKPLRTTTKSNIKSEAEAFAATWYIDKLVEIKSGVIETKQKEKSPTVKDASIEAIDEYRNLVDQGKRSKQYVNSAIIVLNKHILPYFENIPVEDVDSVIWKQYLRKIYKENRNIARSTVHQIRNALSLCMNSAVDNGWIKSIPQFKIESESNKDKKGRVWFKPKEQEILLKALDENAEILKGTPHKKGSLELCDYVKFVLYSGLRVGEANNVKFSDIEIVKPDNDYMPLHYALIRNIKGKRGTGTCKPDRKFLSVFESILKRTNPSNLEQLLFKEHHREMFNTVLNRCNLKHDIDGRKRDFISLRHTYICNKILEQVPHYDIAVNCRTSVDMIEKHYARYLQAEMLDTLHKKDHESIEKEISKIMQAEKKLAESKKQIIDKTKMLAEMLNITIQEAADLIIKHEKNPDYKIGV